jgi:hypothetical protein
VVIINYSDDSIIGLWNEVTKRYDTWNGDLSTNDASHTLYTFCTFGAISNMPTDHFKNLTGQIMAPIRMFSSTRKQHIILLSILGVLHSGLGGTCDYNNNNICMVAYKLGELLDMGHTLCLDLVTLAAHLLGIRFTYEYVDTSTRYGFSKLQFLKTSPIRVMLNGVQKTMVLPNLGRWFKKLGKGKSIITKKNTNFPEHLIPYNQENLYSWYQTLLTYGDFKECYYEPFVKALCPFFSLVNPTHYNLIESLMNDQFNPIKLQSVETFFPTREQLYSRYFNYGITDTAIDEFEGLLKSVGNGTLTYCEALDIIFFADYGYEW